MGKYYIVGHSNAAINVERGLRLFRAYPHLSGGVNDQVLVAAPSDAGKFKSSELASPKLAEFPTAFAREAQENRPVPFPCDAHSRQRRGTVDIECGFRRLGAYPHLSGG